MSDKKLSQLDPASSVASDDLIYVVDISDTSDGSGGSGKKATVTQVANAVLSVEANCKSFDTVADMVSDTTLSQGDTAFTRGYSSSGDGGAAMYRIVSAGTGVADDGFYHDLTGISGQAELIHSGRVSVKQFGAVGDGTTDDTAALQKPFASQAPDNLVVELRGEDTYLQNGNINITSGGFTIIGNGATLKRGPSLTTTLSANAADGATTISVTDVSALNIVASEQIFLVNTGAANGGQAKNEGAGPYTVTGVSGNDLTLGGGIELPADGSLDSGGVWTAGLTVMKAYHQISANENTEPFSVYNTVFDGNRANNTVHYGWSINSCMNKPSKAIIDGCTFHSMPNECMFLGHWSTVTNCTAYDLNGSFTHNSSINQPASTDNNTCYIISNNRLRDVCEQTEAINNHDEGAFTFSGRAGKCVIEGNIVDGCGTAFAGHLTDVGELVISGNLAIDCKGVVAVRNDDALYGNVTISGNTFDTCGALLIAPPSSGARPHDTGLGTENISITGNVFKNVRLYIRYASNFTVAGNVFTWEDGYSPASDQFTIGTYSIDGSAYQLNIDSSLRYSVTGNHFEDYNSTANEITTAIVYELPNTMPGTAIKTDASTSTDYYYYQRDVVISNNSIANYVNGIGHESTNTTGDLGSVINFLISGNTITTKDVAATNSFGIRSASGVVVSGNLVVCNANTDHGIFLMGVNDSAKTSINGDIVIGNTVLGNPGESIEVGRTADATASFNMTVINNVTDKAISNPHSSQNVVSGNVQNKVTSTTYPIYPTRANSGWY